MFPSSSSLPNKQKVIEHKFLQETLKPKNQDTKKWPIFSLEKQIFLSLEGLSARFQELSSFPSLTSKKNKILLPAKEVKLLETNLNSSISIEIPTEIFLAVKSMEQNTFLNFKTARGALNYWVPKNLSVSLKQTAASKKLYISSLGTPNSAGFNKCLRAIYQILIGVTQGYKKKLKIVGVGYKAFLEEKNLKMDLGFSHLKYYQLNSNLQTKFGRKNKRLHLSGTSLPLVAETAASVHAFKKPDVYKGKGIRYRGLKLTKKEGKKKK